jgi:hypothetical protein
MITKNLKIIYIFAILIAGLAGNVEFVRAQTSGPSFDVSFNPGGSQTIGNSVNIHIKVNSSNPGATRIRVSCGGVSKAETSEVEFDSTWNTDGCSAGTQQITIQARSPDDPNWSAANTQTFNYTLTGNQPQQPTQTPAPSTPPQGPNISTFEFNPTGGATVGDNVDIYIVVDSSNPGATKINVSCGGVSKVETSEVSFHSTWYTSGCPGGQATVTVYSRDVNDPNWTNPSSASRNYNLSVPPSYNAPTANFWADAGSVQSGQCTYLHWTTTDADRVDIDGNSVGNSGDKQVCPTVTTRYTLTANGQGGTANRNLTIVVTSQPAKPSIASSFNTGDVINIGGNILKHLMRWESPGRLLTTEATLTRNLIQFHGDQISRMLIGTLRDSKLSKTRFSRITLPSSRVSHPFRLSQRHRREELLPVRKPQPLPSPYFRPIMT